MSRKITGVVIYHIIDHRRRVRYVGRSAKPEQRWSGHLSLAKTENRPLYKWMRRQLTRGFKAELIIASECVGSGVDDESIEIEKYRKMRPRAILNIGSASQGLVRSTGVLMTLRPDEETAIAVEAYRAREDINASAEAVRRLVRKALKAEGLL